jgi:hypothetical protein
MDEIAPISEDETKSDRVYRQRVKAGPPDE